MDINSRESESLSSCLTEKRADHADLTALSEGNTLTPKGGPKGFPERGITGSPESPRRHTVYLSAGSRDLAKTDCNSASLTSSLTDEDGGPVTLEPLEHEWMMCASDGKWQTLQPLLASEPSLVLKKDFVTGFTCFHWAAKLGKPELLALMVNFAKQNNIPVNINTRSSGGYTPLHLATLHNHMEVVKLLVGAYDADVEVRDHNGKKASQYLKNGVTLDIQDIIGACKEPEAEDAENEGHLHRFSKVLQSNFMSLQLPRQNSDSSAQAAHPLRQKPLRRKSTLSKLKPKLNRLSFRKQIVHSKTFDGNGDEEEDALKSSLPSRPKSSLFG
ncbi:ankyrin repeat domain-containing protein SOWAHC-like [Aplochiton taeniatus]